MNLEQVTPLINNSLKTIGLDPNTCKGEKPGQWTATYKDATVWVDVFEHQTNKGKWYFRVMSPLMKITDQNRESFYQDLLEINYNLYNTAMVKFNEWIYVMHLRETDSLDESEIVASFDRVGFYSYDYYGKLQYKFKNDWITQPTTPNQHSLD